MAQNNFCQTCLQMHQHHHPPVVHLFGDVGNTHPSMLTVSVGISAVDHDSIAQQKCQYYYFFSTTTIGQIHLLITQISNVYNVYTSHGK